MAKFFQKIFGSRNEREIKRLQPLVDKINALEPSMEDKSDAELQAFTPEFRQRLDNGASLDDILPEAFAVVRETGKRILKMRHYDVQLIGGIILHQGRIAEMRTGEGKTLVSTLPAYLNGLSGKGVHIVTVNDYLARRDAEWMGQVHNFLGLDVGVVVHGVEDFDRQNAYRCAITYGQNNEFGFDYLRDNMKMSPDRMVQPGLNYAIVDEVDSILIDEARTPLIISGPVEQSANLYREVDRIVPRLQRDVHYTVDEKAHSTILTDAGVERVESLLNIENLYDPDNLSIIHHVNNALKAHTLYKRDVNYLIEEGKVLIIDEFTGRKMPGRRWSDGLHQSIEAKENVTIEEENQTLATVTFQNFFRMYNKLSGMTGTADTEASEFQHIYKLEVTVIPTNKPILRDDAPDLVYKNEKGKFMAVVDDILESHGKGQPVLVGTTSVEKSEVIASVLRKKKFKFEVLNAKQHQREANIVAQAGRKAAITISTNMAGRGTDIILGGNPEALAQEKLKQLGLELKKAQQGDDGGDEPSDSPETSEAGDEHNLDDKYQEILAEYREKCEAEKQEVLAAGGLKIIGTERHESRRIDNQLRGRAGRQGDPGASRFYLSLEDDLMRIFGADRISGLMERLGMEEDVPIEHKWVTKAVENAQKKVEGSNFDSRKNVLEYDDVMNQQRKTIYGLRRQILTGTYVPTLSEDEEKAGQIAEAPTESGTWTEESLSIDLRADVETMVEAALEAERARQQGEEEEDVHEQPIWRQFRHEVWRQLGCQLDDVLEKKFEGPKGDLVDWIVSEVAKSLIQQRERLFDLSDSLISSLVASHCPEKSHEDDWDTAGLESTIHDLFNVDFRIQRGATPQEIAESAWELVEKRIDDREEELGRNWFMYFSRHFYLQEIDKQWIDHLKMMDHLREGIGLRGYGQKDPKKEYKKEGFDLFALMMQNIETNVCRKIFRVEVKKQENEIPELQAKQRQMKAVHPAASATSSEDSVYGDAADGGKAGAKKEKQKTVRREAPKVGRNDPCPCGSGKKYKKCHGKADHASL